MLHGGREDAAGHEATRLRRVGQVAHEEDEVGVDAADHGVHRARDRTVALVTEGHERERHGGRGRRRERARGAPAVVTDAVVVRGAGLEPVDERVVVADAVPGDRLGVDVEGPTQRAVGPDLRHEAAGIGGRRPGEPHAAGGVGAVRDPRRHRGSGQRAGRPPQHEPDRGRRGAAEELPPPDPAVTHGRGP